MTLLLDTHVLVWFVDGDKKLSKNARRAIKSGYFIGALLHLFPDSSDTQTLSERPVIYRVLREPSCGLNILR